FDELTAMASEQFGLGPAPQLLIPRYISSGLPPPSVASHVLPAAVPIPADTTDTPSSPTVDQDVPTTSTLSTIKATQSLVIHEGVEEQPQRNQNAQYDNAPLIHNLTPDPSSEESSSQGVIPSNFHQLNQSFINLRKWTKDHLLDNVIGNTSRPVS
ncbi:hypothetical protein Tco_0240172, partial [Tanacetum coccineum]